MARESTPRRVSIEYQYLEADNEADFQRNLRRLTADGWEPMGETLRVMPTANQYRTVHALLLLRMEPGP